MTDCYQPAERKFQLTRGCVQVALDCRQPIGIVTKNALVTRDIDLLARMAEQSLIHVFVSITTLDAALARDMEPRTSTPVARLRTIEKLTAAGIPTGVMTAPVIPGLNDSEVPEVLKQARQAGAAAAGFVLLRLPLTVQPVFEQWLRRTRADSAERVLSRVRSTRDGNHNQSQFGKRMVGSGEIAEQIRTMFTVFCKQLGLANKLPERDFSRFRPPSDPNGQQLLF